MEAREVRDMGEPDPGEENEKEFHGVGLGYMTLYRTGSRTLLISLSRQMAV